MSDFDKEAEREKLRKRFEQDQQEREATQRMSDLLLKGATMTNTHCNQCQSPIFRQNGEEFCPSCQRAVADESGGAGGETESTPADDDTAQQSDSRPSTPEATTETPQTPDEDTNTQPQSGQAEPSPHPDHAEPASAPTDPAADRTQPPRTADSTTASPDESRRPQQSEADAATTAGAASLSDARSALAEALVTHAQLAAQTTDPRRAREHLETAREAAAALDALPGR
jgi:uncharacterized Zn finger protein (UPF0148 family)